MNRASAYNLLMAASEFGDVEENALRRDLFSKETAMEEDPLWCGEESVLITRLLFTTLQRVVGNLTGVRYRDEVLQPFVVPALQQIGPNAVFQDDNARPHRSAAVNSFIQQEDINRMSWPACSPDLNPIEHLWDEIGRRLRQNYPPAQNRAHLLQQLQEQWNAIPQATVRHLIHSMRQRCVECLQNNGGHTRF